MGLVNLERHCYFNAAIQCLVHLEAFNAYFRSGECLTHIANPSRMRKPNGTVEAFRTLLSAIEDRSLTREARDAAPLALVPGLDIEREGGGCAAEALGCLLDRLRDDLNGCRGSRPPLTLGGFPSDAHWSAYCQANEKKPVKT
jgi:ubiquitin C-terminal hydrolase